MTFYLTTPMTTATRRHLSRRLSLWNEGAADVSFPIDVKNEAEGFVITALLPGVTAEDLTVQVHNNVLSIQGEMKHGREEGAGYLLQERPSGKFLRSFELPDAVDANKVEANLSNGVLTLRLPKAEEARPRSIKVNA